ncbi:40S ribosomal protein S7 [Thelohanellus kitauei]|uniref:40S ribosomal protein S7 n=1 Tax=Thelohanellus kitauei TaxID=669202 RepID=A0A0C2MRV9_THEKT|nr:40S ribosomal protein S7 [Thelohanellus kitauei]
MKLYVVILRNMKSKMAVVGEQASTPSEKQLSPIHLSVLDAFKKLRTHPEIGKAMRRRLPIVNEIKSHNVKCVIIYVKAYILAAIHKILPVLKKETEKILDKQVYFIGYRRIIPKPPKRSAAAKVHRPYRRTVTAVHQSILEDIAFPSEIVGKRTLYQPKTGPLLKVMLDVSHRSELEGRKLILSDVYKRLTRRDVTFAFPIHEDPVKMVKSVGKGKKKTAV